MTEEPVTTVRLSLFLGEDDRHQHRPLYSEIVHRAHQAGLAGATVLRGTEGFGAASAIHTTRLLSMASHLPVVVVIVDSESKIRQFVAELGCLVPNGMACLETVETIHFGGEDER